VANQDTRPPSESSGRASPLVRTGRAILLIAAVFSVVQRLTLTRRWWGFFVSLLPLLLLNAPSAAAASQYPRQVLLLYADEKDLPMNRIIDSQLRSSFREKLGDGVELFSEYLDLTRFPDSRFHSKQLEFLQDKYRAHGLDLIVVIECRALDPIQLHRDMFFPTTPVVFCCVTEADYKARRIGPGVAGIPAKLDYRPTLELALRLHPSTRHVVVVAGATKDDTEIVDEARRDFRPFEGTVEFRYLVGLPMGDLRQEVAQLSGDTIIIYLSMFQDGAGTFFIPRDALVQVAEVARVPIYGYFDSFLGHGIVGGFVASFEIEATNAARLGLRILAGEKPEDVSAEGAPSCAYMFDWRQLKRWGVDEKNLPPGSIVHYQNQSFWDLYRWHIIGVLSVCALQAMLILGLLVQRSRGRRAEREIRQAEERFRLVVESAPNAVVLVSADGNIVLVNSHCEKTFGYRREELLGRPIEILVPEHLRLEHAGYRAAFFSCPAARPPGQLRDLCGRRKDGSEFPVEVGLTPIRTGAGLLVLSVIMDITAQKQAEEARRELTHASRLALVGELTASIAHEINQPLGAILNNADAAEMLLESSPPALDQVREILGDIRRDDLRACEVIRRLRALLSKHEMEFQPVDLNVVSSDVVLLVRAESRRRGVTVVSQPADDLPIVRGDRVHLQQVLLNLVLNSMDAMADATGPKGVTLRTGVHENGSAEVAVSDTGPGISRDHLPRLFDPFFSTKKNGMGLGLSIARSLVEAHGGQIWAENNPGRGATFRFTLPTNREQPNPESRSQPKEPAGATA
jgi:PAS domain S-box-containing protein